ncbi:MAG TPA: CBS and ACT domain-containing protein [Dissulfurispiraceae bacterium]|nr:CBS and ACT domain-containing protein [Dissulfurispiraceae bacterium]
MFVSDWMTRKVSTVTPEDSVSSAMTIMRERNINHLPVVKGEKVAGIVSDRDIKEYAPSKATTLDVYELHYLLDKAKIREIMKKDVTTVSAETPIEEAAMIMHDRDIGCLPVVSGDRLVGIISDKDMYRILVDITGVRKGGHRINLTVEDRPGSIKEVADIIRKHGFGLLSILTSYEGMDPGYRKIVIRARIDKSDDFEGMKKDLTDQYKNIEIKRAV